MSATDITRVVAANQIMEAGVTAGTFVERFLAEKGGAESSISVYRRGLRQYFNWIDETGRNTATMTPADVRAYQRHLEHAKKSPQTIASYMNAVKMFYKWLHDNNATIVNIAAGIDLPKIENVLGHEDLTTGQARQLLDMVAAEASYRDAAIITLLLNCGLRTIEVVRADVKDMQRIGNDWLLKVQGKGHLTKDTDMWLSPDTYAAIKKYLDTERSDASANDPLFTCAGNRNKNGRLTTRTITGIARKYLDKLGLCKADANDRNSRYTAHSLRHTYAMSMYEATDDLPKVQQLLRHKSITTTQVYTRHKEDKQRIEIAKKFNIDDIYRSTINR